jgi:PAS domain S-box-containing protein
MKIDYLEALVTAVIAIIIIDSEGVIKMINQAACTLFGYMKNELLNKNIKILMPEKTSNLHSSYLKQYLETKQTHDINEGS